MERLVDVLDSSGTVIHTYPITLGQPGDEVDDAAYEAKALEAAAHGRLVSDAELRSLSARIHIGRGGQMAPYGDDVASSSETKSGLEQSVRERAYFLWEQDGRPVGTRGGILASRAGAASAGAGSCALGAGWAS